YTPAEWAALDPAARSRIARRIGRGVRPDAAWRVSLAAQRRLAALSYAGLPGAWARLLGRIAAGTGLSRQAGRIMRAQLEWPMELEGSAEAFERLGTKGGSFLG
ncbi:unnamed protein product, partial [marine sediment metagenome]